MPNKPVKNTLYPFAPNNFIGGGCANTICACNAVIGGGYNNCVCGDYSAILGGCGNTDNGLQYVGIFGKNISALAPTTFHVNCLNACDTPFQNTTNPSGTIFKFDSSLVTPLPTGALPLYIMP